MGVKPNGVVPEASHNLYIYICMYMGTKNDNSQWEVQRERILKQDGGVGIMLETQMQIEKLDHLRWLCSFGLHMQQWRN